MLAYITAHLSHINDKSVSTIEPLMQVLVLLMRNYPRAISTFIAQLILTISSTFTAITQLLKHHTTDDKPLIPIISAYQRVLKVLATPQYRKIAKKHAPVILSHFITQYNTVVTFASALAFNDITEAMYLVLDVCGEHEKACLMAAFDDAEKQNFKAFYTDYNKFHKFIGKI